MDDDTVMKVINGVVNDGVSMWQHTAEEYSMFCENQVLRKYFHVTELQKGHQHEVMDKSPSERLGMEMTQPL